MADKYSDMEILIRIHKLFAYSQPQKKTYLLLLYAEIEQLPIRETILIDGEKVEAL